MRIHLPAICLILSVVVIEYIFFPHLSPESGDLYLAYAVGYDLVNDSYTQFLDAIGTREPSLYLIFRISNMLGLPFEVLNSISNVLLAFLLFKLFTKSGRSEFFSVVMAVGGFYSAVSFFASIRFKWALIILLLATLGKFGNWVKATLWGLACTTHVLSVLQIPFATKLHERRVRLQPATVILGFLLTIISLVVAGPLIVNQLDIKQSHFRLNEEGLFDALKIIVIYVAFILSKGIQARLDIVAITFLISVLSIVLGNDRFAMIYYLGLYLYCYRNKIVFNPSILFKLFEIYLLGKAVVFYWNLVQCGVWVTCAHVR